MRRLFIFLSIIPALVWGQDSLNVRRVGVVTDYWDSASEIVVQDTLAYLAVGQAGLRVVNVADIANPVEIGRLLDWWVVRSVAVSGNYAYLLTCNEETEEQELAIVDVSNPREPLAVSRYEVESCIGELAAQDGILFMTLANELTILDMSNPHSPIEIGRLPTEFSTRRIILHDTLAYIANYYGVGIIDISAPTSPVLLAQLHLSDEPLDMALSGEYVFVAVGDAGLRVVDIANPIVPEEIPINNERSAYFVGAIGTHIFISGSGMSILDFADITHPVELLHNNLSFAAITTSGDQIFTTGLDPEVSIWENTGTNFVEIGQLNARGLVSDLALSGNYAFVTDDAGVRVFDITNPEQLTAIDSLDSPYTAYHLDLADNYAYLADYQTLRVIDVSEPTAIELVDSLFPRPGITALAANGGYLYVGSGGYIHVYDITSSSLPTLIDSIQVSGHPSTIYDIKFSGDIAYCELFDAIEIIDISDPANLEIIGEYDPSVHLTGMDVNGDLLFVSENEGLRILSLSTPSAPSEIGWVDLPHAVSVFVNDHYALVSCWEKGIYIIDVSTPASPEIVGWYNMHSWAVIGAMQQSIAYSAGFYELSGYDVSAALSTPEHRNELPTSFAMHPIYPNPFNNTANISFDLPREVTGRLVVYDVLGRMTNALYDGKLAAGSHQLQFNGNSLSSGAYFVRLETPNYSATQKAVLLK